MKKKLVLFLFVFVLSVLIGSTGAPTRAGAATPGPDLQIHFGGSSPGAVMFYTVGAFANSVTPRVPGINITNVTTGAAVDNAIRVAQGDLDLGITYAMLAHELITNTGIFSAPQWHGMGADLTAVAIAYESDFYFVAFRDSGIESIMDLNGRTVSTGAPGSGAQFLSNLVLDVFELNVNREHLAFADTVFAMREGRVEALGVAGSPAGAISELSETDDVIIIPWTREQIDKLIEVNPFFYADYMPPIYRGMDGPVLLPHFRNYIIAHRSVPEQAMYDMLHAAFQPDVLAEMILVHRNWESFAGDCRTATELGIEVHPGARRFFEENPWAPNNP